MKKLLFLLLISIQSISYASKRCMAHQGRFLRKYAPVQLDGTNGTEECNCPCWSQPRSKHVDHYKCLMCGHRLLPEDVIQDHPIIEPKQHNAIDQFKQSKTA